MADWDASRTPKTYEPDTNTLRGTTMFPFKGTTAWT
jgi:hypothetical protein